MTPPVIFLNAPEHPIKSVTVLASAKAEVKGQNKVELRNLPTTIDTQSIRVRIADHSLSHTITTGANAPRVFDLIARMRPMAYHEPESPSEALRGLKVNLAALEREKAIRVEETAILTDYGISITAHNIDPSKLDDFLDQYVARTKSSAQAIASLDEQILQLNREIDVKTQNAAAKMGTTCAEADIVILAPKDTATELVISYLVSDVSWNPTYELQTTTDSYSRLSSTTLYYRAKITQRTGEDWDDTNLTLSTVAESVIAGIPTLQPVKIRYVAQSSESSSAPESRQPSFGETNLPTQGQVFGTAQQQQQQSSVPQSFDPFGTSVSLRSVATTAAFGAQTRPTQAPSVPRASSYDDFESIDHCDTLIMDSVAVTETPVALTFKLDKGELVSIPSDGAQHQVTIASIPLEGSISHVCVPKADPRVYLECEMKNTSDYQLLRGPVSVFFDDSYISSTNLTETPPNGTFFLPLGTESSKGAALSNRTTILYTRSSTIQPANPHAPTLDERTQTTSYKTTVVIKNNHNYDLSKVVIKDVIHTPVGATDNWTPGTTPSDDSTPQDSRIQVVLKNPDLLGKAADGDIVQVFPKPTTFGVVSGVPEPTLYEGKVKDASVKWSKLGVDGSGGEKEGKYEWVISGLKAGAEIYLVSEWDAQAFGASWPGRWEELRMPGPGAV